MEKLFVAIYDSPVGPLYPVVDARQRVHWLDSTPPPEEWGCTPDWEACRTLIGELQEYFQGTRRAFSLQPVFAAGISPFRAAVWNHLSAIPYGTVESYGEVAKAIGSPGAARAVGSAAAGNRILIIVPCHRVVPAIPNSLSGKGAGSYRLGSTAKTYLLKLEGCF